MNRREFIRRAAITSVFAVIGLVGAVEFAEKLVPARATVLLTQTTQSTQTNQSAQSAPQGYFYVGTVSSLGSSSYAYFSHPNYGNAILILVSGQWKAFTATCTHQPCTVEYTNSEIYCPCHGGTFNASTGAVTGGPPPSPLTQFSVLVQSGAIYVSSQVI